MSSTTGLVLSYAIGLIFLVGGVLFLAFLDEDRLLFGLPYLLIGLLLIVGVRASQRRRAARAAAPREDDGSPEPQP